MGRPISLFTNYSQAENRVTNYCGLMMKLIYEESPRRFGLLLDRLTAGVGELVVGPVFDQQPKSQASVPDLIIAQQAFTIAFENKLTNWFYSDQIQRHLQGLGHHNGTLILFLLSNFESDLQEQFKADIERAQQNKIYLFPLTYEKLLLAFDSVCTTDPLSGFLDEFRAYIEAENLLPSWRYLLDVVNCGNTMHEIESGAYLCPNTGGAYNHKRARWLGAYSKKEVRSVYELEALVTVDVYGVDAKLKWNNQSSQSSEQLLERVVRLAIDLRPEQSRQIALQVFLLGQRAETRFVKESSGGMLGSKQYFWHERFGTGTLTEVAQFLADTGTWEKFKGNA